MARILIIDDDSALVRALRVGLAGRGHEVTGAVTAEDGLAKVALARPEVVVLDLGLPDVDGIEVCRRIREWSDLPVIVLSAVGLEARKVAALDEGADDYVTKPFGMSELEARIRAQLRHAGAGADGGPIVVGQLALDPGRRQADLAGARLRLTSKEFDLLAFLARHEGKVCTHQTILGAVWGPGYGDEVDYLRVYVYRLRQKLDDGEGRFVRTVPGVGYALEPERSAGGRASVI